ncbi:MAG TPA: dihydrofolate reductase family protein, partial [Acidimicrobiales bacterium]|nr:dihydrofolate reductase family protein [Acidimicrobiales bacterium]
MGTVHGAITISLDGYYTGPDDGPGRGLGVGGERLHSWVFGGPWRYEDPQRGEPYGADKAWLEETTAANGAVVAGRGTFEAAGHWGGTNPWPFPCVVVTHRTSDVPDVTGFHFARSPEEAVARAQALAGDRQVHVMGGGQIIRQLLAAGYLDELT